jgi:nucleoid-associated protein YejK
MANREWYSEGVQYYESGEEEYYSEGVQLSENQATTGTLKKFAGMSGGLDVNMTSDGLTGGMRN